MTAHLPGESVLARAGEAIERAPRNQVRIGAAGLLYGFTLLVLALAALGWRWTSPGNAISDLEKRVTITEKRIDSLAKAQAFANYMLCTQRPPGSDPPNVAQFVQQACARAVAAMEQP